MGKIVRKRQLRMGKIKKQSYETEKSIDAYRR